MTYQEFAKHLIELIHNGEVAIPVENHSEAQKVLNRFNNRLKFKATGGITHGDQDQLVLKIEY